MSLAENGTNRSAMVRTRLASRFIYKSWYHRIRRVTTGNHSTTVNASLPKRAKSRRVAREICLAVLSLKLSKSAVVHYAHDSGATCP